MGIEIKFSSSPKISQGMQICLDDLNLPKGYVITPDTERFQLSKTIEICSLETFLNTILP